MMSAFVIGRLVCATRILAESEAVSDEAREHVAAALCRLTASRISRHERLTPYCRARNVSPIVRGSLGVPRISPELPAWIVTF